ncbi:MAG: hypothetical protein U0974_11815 [Gemmatimonadales bacterium]|nr:hypothetical protein [Gemmatimonadales bacterium]MDZ4390402.1 hypothetical protein [Gemmatimonadales bacterium]
MAGEDIRWRRGIERLAADLRALDVRFECRVLPLGENGLFEGEILSLTEQGEVEHHYEGATEYLVRVEAGISLAAVQSRRDREARGDKGLEGERGPFGDLVACLARANEALSIPLVDVFGGGEDPNDEQEAPDDEQSLLLGEWHLMMRPFADVVGEVMAERGPPIGPLVLVTEDGSAGDEESDLCESAQAAHGRYRWRWERGLGSLGPALWRTAAADPEGVVTGAFGPVVMAGEGRVHPVLSQFPQVLQAMPAHMARLLPTSVVWCVWPDHTQWSRPSLALPSASRLTWGVLGEWGSADSAENRVVAHPLGRYAPIGYRRLSERAEQT